MKNIKDLISQVITSKPDIIQFAKDRKFEESWVITLASKSPTEQDNENYLLTEKFKTLIVEYVWDSHDDDKRFVITIFLDEGCRMKDPNKFLHICLDNFYHYPGFSKLINIFNTQIIGSKYLLEYPVESVNLSVFNYWLSVGPLELWELGDNYDIDSIVNKIKSRPEIARTRLNYQGLFFRFNVSGQYQGPYYGIKTPCCNKVGKEWIIDYEKVDYWIKLMLGRIRFESRW